MSGSLPVGTWTIDAARSSVAFQVKHLGVATVEGRFDSFAGTLEVTAEGVAARGAVRVDSVDTGDPHRDSLLLTGSFFDAETHPEISFASTGVAASSGRTLEIFGQLTMRSVTRPLTLAVTIRQGAEEDRDGTLVLSARARLSRSEYELRFRGPMAAGNRAVADGVSIALQLTAVPAS